MSKRLPLTRIALLNDAFEGATTRGAYEAAIKRPTGKAGLAIMSEFWRSTVYVSCWHANNSESEAMWRLYCGDHEGIALCTTYERLDASLPANTYIGKVTYVGSTSERGLDTNVVTSIMHKRLAFEHEREVRVVVWEARGFLQSQGVVVEPLVNAAELFGAQVSVINRPKHFPLAGEGEVTQCLGTGPTNRLIAYVRAPISGPALIGSPCVQSEPFGPAHECERPLSVR